MESTEERLDRDWLNIKDDRADRELWSMSQERRDRLYSPALIGETGPAPEEPENTNIYAENYKELY